MPSPVSANRPRTLNCSIDMLIPSPTANTKPLEPPVVEGDTCRLGPGTGAGLPDGGGEMVAHSAFGQVKFPGDVGDRAAVASSTQYVGLPPGQRTGPSHESLRGQRWINHPQSLVDPSYGVCQ